MNESTHKYYKYEEPKLARKNQRLIAQYLMNHYLNKDYSVTKLRKIKKARWSINVSKNDKKWKTKEISYQIIDDHLMRNNSFDHDYFNLPKILCPWLDGDIAIAMDQHFVDVDNIAPRIEIGMPFGKKFPVSPYLDREGVLHNTFQQPLMRRIITLRKRLIADSAEFKSENWLFDLVSLISSCVSIVEITLHKLYIKAEYDPFDGWCFDKKEVGERYNRRFKDKIKWVQQITGNVFDDATDEMKSFNFLREIRNHTQHFDPPCFGFTLEEVTSWLNIVKDIGMLLFKIRRKINSKINEDIIRLILLPDVSFNGIELFGRERLPHSSGYRTTCWKGGDD